MIKGRRRQRRLGETLFTFGMTCVVGWILRTRLVDINAQPKIFPRRLLESFKNPPHDFSLDLYLLYRAKFYSYRILSFDVLFNKRQFGESKWAYSFKSRYKTIIRTVHFIRKLKTHLLLEEAAK